MLFEKVCGNPNIVREAIEEVEGVNEGWGMALAWTACMAGVIGGGIVNALGNPILGFGITSAAALPMIQAVCKSNKNLNKTIKDKRFQKYIINTCNNIYKKEKNSNKNLTNIIPNNDRSFLDKVISKFKQYNPTYSKFTDRIKYLNVKKNTNEMFNISCPQYTVFMFHDTDHIDSVKLCLYDKKEDTLNFYNVPAPSKNDLGFYEE